MLREFIENLMNYTENSSRLRRDTGKKSNPKATLV